MREAELAEAGRITAAAYAELAEHGGTDWRRYLEVLADVAGRAIRATVLVAVAEGRVLGSVTLELGARCNPDSPPLAPGEAHARMLGVDPAQRRRGIGRLLMQTCIERAREAGRSRLTLHTAESMVAARLMYEQLGFQRLPDAEVEGMRLLTYELDLGPEA